MSVSDEIKNKIGEHNEMLKDHDERIRSLEINSARTEEILSNLEKNQEKLSQDIQELKNTTLNTNNAVLSSINQLIITRENNSTQQNISKYTNLTEVIKQVILTGGTVLLALWGGSHLIK